MVSLVPWPPQAFNVGFGFKSGVGLVDFVPSSLRQVDTIVTSCLIFVLGEFTAFYQAELKDSTSPSQYTALQLSNGTLQTVGSRLLDTKATRLTCTRGLAQHTFFDMYKATVVVDRHAEQCCNFLGFPPCQESEIQGHLVRF